MIATFRTTFTISLALLFVSAPSQATPVYTPEAVQKQSKQLINQEITVRGIFTMLAGSMALLEDVPTYKRLGECCGLPHGNFLFLRRSDDIWNVRERYEGATVFLRGRLQSEHCFRFKSRNQCYGEPSIVVQEIHIVTTAQRAVVPERLNDLAPVEASSPEQPALNALTERFLQHLDRNDHRGLTTLFALDLYPVEYAPDTFREEFGQARVASETQITELYTELMSDPNGRARWLYFSTEAGPARRPARSLYRFFTEYIPVGEIENAVACFARTHRADRWPRSVVSVVTQKTTDPYTCYFLLKSNGIWRFDFERNYMAGGRYPPVP